MAENVKSGREWIPPHELAVVVDRDLGLFYSIIHQGANLCCGWASLP